MYYNMYIMKYMLVGDNGLKNNYKFASSFRYCQIIRTGNSKGRRTYLNPKITTLFLQQTELMEEIGRHVYAYHPLWHYR